MLQVKMSPMSQSVQYGSCRPSAGCSLGVGATLSSQAEIVEAHARVGPVTNLNQGLLKRSGGPLHSHRDIFPWQVVHACEQARDILMLVEAELAVGMRPFLVTPRGFGAAASYLRKPHKEAPFQISLLRAWNHVRNWKRLLAQSDPDGSAEVLHAHSFAAGMASVRSAAPVVYDLLRPIERIAIDSGQCKEKSWIGRSFRAAEQFVLAHAGAVVVHDDHLRDECLERGVEKRNLFLVPEPIDSALFDSVPDRQWIQQRIGATARSAIFFVAPGKAGAGEMEQSISILMSAFSQVRSELESIKLVWVEDENAAAVLRQAGHYNLGRITHLLPESERDQALASCDIVIALEKGLTPSKSAEHRPDVISEAMARGRAVLAAESEDRRSPLSPRSYIGFPAEDARRLACRAAFLARNPDFCRVLSALARQHLIATRGYSRIGEIYDEIYAHASANRKPRHAGPSDPQLIPIPMNL